MQLLANATKVIEYYRAAFDFLANKNKLINDFKGKYSDQSKITGETQENNQKQTELFE